MDHLTEERYAEHEPHGWHVRMELMAIHNTVQVPGYWMDCSCGWVGWIAQDANREPIERYERR